jgi:hypothetical protein
MILIKQSWCFSFSPQKFTPAKINHFGSSWVPSAPPLGSFWGAAKGRKYYFGPKRFFQADGMLPFACAYQPISAEMVLEFAFANL